MSQTLRPPIDVRDRPDERSLPELLSEVTSDLTTLVRKELELAKLEAKEEAAKAGKAAGMLGAAALTGYMALLFSSFAVAWLLDDVMPRTLAYLLVAIVYGIAATALAVLGRQQLKEIRPVPEQTIETLKEDVQWARAQRS